MMGNFQWAGKYYIYLILVAAIGIPCCIKSSYTALASTAGCDGEMLEIRKLRWISTFFVALEMLFLVSPAFVSFFASEKITETAYKICLSEVRLEGVFFSVFDIFIDLKDIMLSRPKMPPGFSYHITGRIASFVIRLFYALSS